MKLPNCEHAIIPIEKLSDYLLSLSHPVGGSKARYFRAIGFNEGNIEAFKEGLLKIAQSKQIVDEKISPYGIKYIIDDILETPSGEEIFLRTVWIIETGQTVPRFVTAYPG